MKLMKKAAAAIILMMLPAIMFGQAQINTKKVKIGDFTQKVTKIVLTGNQFLDGTLQDEVTLRWRISPYEFCSIEEFNRIKTDENYYFLLTTNVQYKNDSTPSIQFLTLVKGGVSASEGIHKMLEVVSMPIASARFPSGRELIFLPAFLDIIQDYTLDAMENDQKGYGGLAAYAGNIKRYDGHRIVFSENDLNENITESDKEQYFGGDMLICSEEETDRHLLNTVEDVLVSYVVAPYDPQPGALCYKMLIDAGNHRLCYFKRDRITDAKGQGFHADEIKKIFKASKR